MSFDGYTLLDVHGHMSGPPQVRAFAYNLIALPSPGESELEAGTKQRGVDQMVFGSEAPGSGTGVKNSERGRPSDDLVPVLDRMAFLTAEHRRKILHDNAIRVFPRLAARLRTADHARA